MDKGSVERWIKTRRSELCQRVTDMSQHILEQDKEMQTLRDKLLQLHAEVTMARSAEAHMRGYIERVKELDSPKDAST